MGNSLLSEQVVGYFKFLVSRFDVAQMMVSWGLYSVRTPCTPIKLSSSQLLCLMFNVLYIVFYIAVMAFVSISDRFMH